MTAAVWSLNCVRLFATPGSSVYGTSQTRMMGWVTISSSRGSYRLGIKPTSLALAGGLFTTEPSGKPQKWLQEVKRHSVHLSNLSAQWKLGGSPKENLGEAAPQEWRPEAAVRSQLHLSCDLGLVDWFDDEGKMPHEAHKCVLGPLIPYN